MPPEFKEQIQLIALQLVPPHEDYHFSPGYLRRVAETASTFPKLQRLAIQLYAGILLEFSGFPEVLWETQREIDDEFYIDLHTKDQFYTVVLAYYRQQIVTPGLTPEELGSALYSELGLDYAQAVREEEEKPKDDHYHLL